MKTVTKIIISAVGTFVVVLVLGIASVIWLSSDEEYNKNYEAARIEGHDFGSTTDNNGCMKEGLSRAPGTRLTEISKVTVKAAFVDECLKASRPVSDFCKGVPWIISINNMEWRENQCELAGLDPDRTACLAVFDKKIDYCNLKK